MEKKNIQKKNNKSRVTSGVINKIILFYKMKKISCLFCEEKHGYDESKECFKKNIKKFKSKYIIKKIMLMFNDLYNKSINFCIVNKNNEDFITDKNDEDIIVDNKNEKKFKNSDNNINIRGISKKLIREETLFKGFIIDERLYIIDYLNFFIKNKEKFKKIINKENKVMLQNEKKKKESENVIGKKKKDKINNEFDEIKQKIEKKEKKFNLNKNIILYIFSNIINNKNNDNNEIKIVLLEILKIFIEINFMEEQTIIEKVDSNILKMFKNCLLELQKDGKSEEKELSVIENNNKIDDILKQEKDLKELSSYVLNYIIKIEKKIKINFSSLYVHPNKIDEIKDPSIKLVLWIDDNILSCLDILKKKKDDIKIIWFDSFEKAKKFLLKEENHNYLKSYLKSYLKKKNEKNNLRIISNSIKINKNIIEFDDFDVVFNYQNNLYIPNFDFLYDEKWSADVVVTEYNKKDIENNTNIFIFFDNIFEKVPFLLYCPNIDFDILNEFSKLKKFKNILISNSSIKCLDFVNFLWESDFFINDNIVYSDVRDSKDYIKIENINTSNDLKHTEIKNEITKYKLNETKKNTRK